MVKATRPASPPAPRRRRAVAAPALAASPEADALTAAEAWQAFDDAMALWPAADLAAPAAWCSPAFVARLGLAPAAAPTLDQLCQRLQGLDSGLAALGMAPAAGTAQASSAPGSAPASAWDGALWMRGAEASTHTAGGAADDDRAAAGAPAAVLQAGLRRLPDGALALRLRAAPEPWPEPVPEELAHAARRHLEDRERLLFTSRSVAVGEMATTLAHELNQPLGSVTNVLRGLKARIGAAIAQPQPQPGTLPMLEQGVQLALDQVQYAARIIGRIRDYTQSRQPRRERVDLHALLHDSLTLLDWDLERHGVRLTVALAPQGGEDTAVAGDGVMLQQVMVNLLRNAIDAMSATPAGQRQLHIDSRIDIGAGQIEIAIADTGCGIGDDGAAQLFMPFYSTKPTGMGIGLNICRSLIELHQGRLWFTPNAARGCTFHVALPLAQGEEARQLPRFLDAESTVS